MEIIENKTDDTEKHVMFNYTYILKPGISKIKGGVKVFQDLDYPTSIVDVMRDNV